MSRVIDRIEQLQRRYQATYGDELSRDEIARYVNGLVIDRQRDELRIFDQLGTEELVETMRALDDWNTTSIKGIDVNSDGEIIAKEAEWIKEAPLVESESEEPPHPATIPPVAPVPPSIGKKPRGRPVGWRKAK